MDYCEHTTFKYMATFLFIGVLDVGHLKRKYFLYLCNNQRVSNLTIFNNSYPCLLCCDVGKKTCGFGHVFFTSLK